MMMTSTCRNWKENKPVSLTPGLKLNDNLHRSQLISIGCVVESCSSFHRIRKIRIQALTTLVYRKPHCWCAVLTMTTTLFHLLRSGLFVEWKMWSFSQFSISEGGLGSQLFFRGIFWKSARRQDSGPRSGPGPAQPGPGPARARSRVRPGPGPGSGPSPVLGPAQAHFAINFKYYIKWYIEYNIKYNIKYYI